jgi:hypothetical protein
MNVGGVGVCSINAITGAVAATGDIEAGTFSGTIPLRADMFVGAGAGDPCPRCIGGTCSGGARNGLACTAQGTSTVFGDTTSLDCHPSGPPNVSLPYTLPLSTGFQQVVLSAASPACTAFGFTSLRCHCSTCQTARVWPIRRWGEWARRC